MRKARQPVSTADYRVFGVAVSFDPVRFPIYPGGAIKFVNVQGAPPEGIVCQMPPAVPEGGSLMFPLRLLKDGAFEDTVTINTVLYRKQVEVESDNEGGGEGGGGEGDANGSDDDSDDDLPQWVIDQTARRLPAAASTAAVALLAEEPPLGDAEADAVAAAGESNALAWLQPGCGGEPGSVLLFLDVDGVLNKGIATYADPAALSIQGWPHALDIELLRRLKSVLTQSGAAIVLSSAWRDNDLGKDLLARGFAAVGISCDVVVGATPLQGTTRIDEIKAWLASRAPECERWVAVDDMDLLADAPELSAHVVRTSTDAGLTADAAEECVAKLAAPPPPPPPVPPPVVALPPTPRPQRERKRKGRYGDNGELDGAASSFRSAPAARKASVDPSVEMGVPAYALPGEQVWAMGLHAGTRKRFKAEVVKLRTQFPRIMVKYTATEDDNTAAIALPEMRTAYLTMADVEPKDW
jgi:hypothetical protein